MVHIQDLKCPNCGSSILYTSRVCSYCGAGLALSDDAAKFVLAGVSCPSCRIENKHDDLFCRNCGTSLTKVCFACNAPMAPNATHCTVCGRSYDDSRYSLRSQLKRDRQSLIQERGRLAEARKAIAEYIEGHHANIRNRRKKINTFFVRAGLGSVAILIVATLLPISQDVFRWIGLVLFSLCGVIGLYSMIDAVCAGTAKLEQEVIRFQFELYSLADQERDLNRRVEANAQQLEQLSKGAGPLWSG